MCLVRHFAKGTSSVPPLTLLYISLPVAGVHFGAKCWSRKTFKFHCVLCWKCFGWLIVVCSCQKLTASPYFYLSLTFVATRFSVLWLKRGFGRVSPGIFRSKFSVLKVHTYLLSVDCCFSVILRARSYVFGFVSAFSRPLSPISANFNLVCSRAQPNR